MAVEGEGEDGCEEGRGAPFIAPLQHSTLQNDNFENIKVLNFVEFSPYLRNP